MAAPCDDAAGRVVLRDREIELDQRTVEGVLERDLRARFVVLAADRARTAGARTGGATGMGVARTGRAAAREVGEQVAEIEVRTRAAGTRTGAGAEPTVATVAATPVGGGWNSLPGRCAELVVGGALLGIAQRRVGLGDFQRSPSGSFETSGWYWRASRR